MPPCDASGFGSVRPVGELAQLPAAVAAPAATANYDTMTYKDTKETKAATTSIPVNPPSLG